MKKLYARELSRNQTILHLNVISQHDWPWPIEHCLLHIRIFFWRENKEAMFWSFHPLADKTNHEHLPKHFSRSYENRYQQPSFMSLGRPICKELRQRTHCINSSRSQLRRQQFEANIYVRDLMDWGIFSNYLTNITKTLSSTYVRSSWQTNLVGNAQMN